MLIKVLKTVAGGYWHVTENEVLELDERFARFLVNGGIAEAITPVVEAAVITPKRNAARKPQLTTRG